jgi:hypothetical protein
MSKASQKSSLIQIIEDFKTEGDARLVVFHTSSTACSPSTGWAQGLLKLTVHQVFFDGEKISNIILEKTFSIF